MDWTVCGRVCSQLSSHQILAQYGKKWVIVIFSFKLWRQSWTFDLNSICDGECSHLDIQISAQYLIWVVPNFVFWGSYGNHLGSKWLQVYGTHPQIHPTITLCKFKKKKKINKLFMRHVAGHSSEHRSPESRDFHFTEAMLSLSTCQASWLVTIETTLANQNARIFPSWVCLWAGEEHKNWILSFHYL